MDQRTTWGYALVKVCVYVEGGGPYAKSQTATACRKAFHLFFERALGNGPKPRIVASSSRDEAYNDFSRSLAGDSDVFAVLLVDSEDPVTGGTATAHLRQREHQWTKPMSEDQVYLMVQCMEAWFLADKEALAQYFGKKFKVTMLPPNPNIEEIPKKDVLSGVAGATKATNKGPYHKTGHGFDILERIDPAKVKQLRHMRVLSSSSSSEA